MPGSVPTRRAQCRSRDQKPAKSLLRTPWADSHPYTSLGWTQVGLSKQLRNARGRRRLQRWGSLADCTHECRCCAHDNDRRHNHVAVAEMVVWLFLLLQACGIDGRLNTAKGAKRRAAARRRAALDKVAVSTAGSLYSAEVARSFLSAARVEAVLAHVDNWGRRLGGRRQRDRGHAAMMLVGAGGKDRGATETVEPVSAAGTLRSTEVTKACGAALLPAVDGVVVIGELRLAEDDFDLQRPIGLLPASSCKGAALEVEVVFARCCVAWQRRITEEVVVGVAKIGVLIEELEHVLGAVGHASKVAAPGPAWRSFVEVQRSAAFLEGGGALVYDRLEMAKALHLLNHRSAARMVADVLEILPVGSRVVLLDRPGFHHDPWLRGTVKGCRFIESFVDQVVERETALLIEHVVVLGERLRSEDAHLLEQRRRRGRRWRHSERWRWWRRLCLDDNVEGGRALAHAAFQLEKILPRCRVVRKRCLAEQIAFLLGDVCVPHADVVGASDARELRAWLRERATEVPVCRIGVVDSRRLAKEAGVLLRPAQHHLHPGVGQRVLGPSVDLNVQLGRADHAHLGGHCARGGGGKRGGEERERHPARRG
mmetsp:Transcript_21652/g.65725  ORF Transcript_21652/g.65725 Transcript_21652/m.65725 type:complete len:597 (+) Transcript_21652:374-2164(+)